MSKDYWIIKLPNSAGDGKTFIRDSREDSMFGSRADALHFKTRHEARYFRDYRYGYGGAIVHVKKKKKVQLKTKSDIVELKNRIDFLRRVIDAVSTACKEALLKDEPTR